MKVHTILTPFAVLFVACSSSSQQANTPGTPTSACDAYVTAQTTHNDRCKSSGTQRSSNPAFQKENLVLYYQSLLAAPGSGLNAQAVLGCAGALGDATCALDEGDVPECKALNEAKGSLAADAACIQNHQCASGYCKGGNVDDEGVACGKCTERLPIGAACTASSACVRGAQCAGLLQDKKCTARLPEGASCGLDLGDGASCGDGLYCSVQSQKCEKRGPEGSKCSGYGSCAGELVCVSGTCQVRLADGAACKSEEAACDLALDCDGGACKARPRAKLGESCKEVPCEQAFACRGGVCVAPKAAGETCQPKVDACARYSICTSGKCAAPDLSTCK